MAMAKWAKTKKYIAQSKGNNIINMFLHNIQIIYTNSLQ